jgi:hypothetical protein
MTETLTLAKLKKKSLKDNFDQIVSDLKHAFMEDFTDEEASRYAGIATSTFYEWKKSSEEFKVVMESAKDYVAILAKHIIADKVNEGDEDMAKWYLERRQRDSYSTKSNVEHEGGLTINITPSKYSDGDKS